MWSAGVTLYQMLCNRHPFQSDYVEDTIKNIIEVNYDLSILEKMNISEEAIDLV